MRVAIDARPAVAPQRTGVGHYTWQLIRRLPPADPSIDFVAWYLNAGSALQGRRFFSDVTTPNLSERGTPIPAGVFNRLDASFDVPRWEWFVRFDVGFAPNFVPPPTRARRLVVTVHDLGFRMLPSTAPQVVPWWLRRLESTLRTATRVIVPSKSTRRDVEAAYGVEPERIEVIPLGVDAEIFRPATADEVTTVRRRFGIDGRYVVFLGLDARKNLPRLLEAFAGLPGSSRPQLVLAGGTPWDPSGVDHVRRALDSVPSEIGRQVVATGYVSERTKAALLGGAEALVYPSLYEGFGLPVLEAMSCGTPVLTSGVSALPEVTDGAAVLVDPNDTDAIAAGLESILTDEELRANLRRDGPARARTFSWDRTARATAALLRTAAGEPG